MARADNTWIYALLGVGTLFILTRTDSQGDTIVGNVLSSVRGIRNNNPGNIRRSGIAWQGLSPLQTDESFFQFVDMAHGIRAIGKILLTYQSRGIDSIDRIINTWAPPNENDTGAYVAAVSASTGADPGDSLDVQNPDTMFALIRAIIRHENGLPSALIPDSTVRDGVAMALGS